MLTIISFLNIPLVIVGIAIALSLILGTVVVLNDRKSITNITFFFFSLSAVFWNVCNYLFYQPDHSPEFALLLLRLVIFFAIWYCFFLFQLFFVFPKKEILFPWTYWRVLFPVVVIVSITTLTSFVFKAVTSLSSDGRVATVLNGLGIYIFGVVVVFLILFGFFVLIKKLFRTQSKSAEREQLTYILIGAIITFSLHIVFNMILPAFFNISQFTALGAIFTLPFSIFTSFAIIKYRLFNVKTIATELITFSLWILLLMRALTSSSQQDRFIDIGILLSTIVVGVLLIRSVMKEVKQKEELYQLNIELAYSIQQRESLVHLVTHKVKSSFTHTKYIFAGILDGTFGPISDEIKKRAEQGLESDDAGIQTVDLVLNAANLQRGGVKYDMKNIDLKDLVLKSIEEKKVSADKKGLKIESEIKEGEYNIFGDVFWLKEALNNLIENSIKYTKEGEIKVGLERRNGKTLFSVKDNGIGLTPEDRKILFTEGGRGRDSVKINVDSTGYGLYTVKLVVDTHKGRVWAESEGPGKGSQFYIELDAVKTS